MAEALRTSAFIAEVPDLQYVIPEDDEPVDNLFSEKQQRLLVEPLYASWHPGRPFLAAANVGIFNAVYQPPIVPDMFLSLDVEPDEDIWKKENRSYFLWKFGKPPELVIEIVSNVKGGEVEKKFKKYAQIGCWYYVVFDPQHILQREALSIYQLSIGRYVPKPDGQFANLGLGLKVWNGMFEGFQTQWLRWCDAEGRLLLTGAERAEQLAVQLRQLGIEPAL
jgi:Uma2 family endonuclease